MEVICTDKHACDRDRGCRGMKAFDFRCCFMVPRGKEIDLIGQNGEEGQEQARGRWEKGKS